jgi:glycosyltransferase involved in cell wall biosynthesis
VRIAHVTATFPPYYAGTGLVCYYNARELARRGHEVHVFTAQVEGALLEEEIEGFQVHRLKPWFRFGNAPFMPGLLMLKGFDLIHLHHPFIFGAEMVRLVSSLRRVPYVLTHHNDLIGNGFRKPLFEIYRLFTARFVFRGASLILAVTKDHALAGVHSKLLISLMNKLVEHPNGVDVEIFSPQTEKDRSKYKLPENSQVILFVGALDSAHYYRRVDLLLKAFRRLGDEELFLLLVGGGNLVDDLKMLAQQLDVEKRTRFLGNISHEQLPQLYNLADVVVLPSSIQESFGLVLVEAMACGTPVITSNLPGVQGIVEDGVNGYLVPPADEDELTLTLRQFLSLSPAKRREIGAAGRRKVESKFTWQLAGERLEAIYHQVLGESDLFERTVKPARSPR